METIRELREICQSSRRQLDSWHMKYIARKPSIYITWLLLHTPISANGASLLVILVSLIAGIIFMHGSKLSFFAGSVVLQLWFIMDMVDGEIARYRKQTSVTGIYLDALSHYISHPFVFFGIGIGLYRRYGDMRLLLLSMLAAYSVAMITVLWDVLKGVLYDEALKKPSFPAIKHGDNDPSSENGRNILKQLFSVLHLVCTFPTIMNVMFLVSVANLVVRQDLVVIMIVFYAFAATFIWIARASVFVKERKPDTVIGK